MNLKIPIPRVNSIPVDNYSDIKADAESMIERIEAGKFPGKHADAVALAHVQMEYTTDKPYRFFVVLKRLVKPGLFKHQIIINPHIIQKSATKMTEGEGCMSFPHRDPKHIQRHFDVEVEYQTPNMFGHLKTYQGIFTGLAARAFQHEIMHFDNITIY